jgi:hypothetical protein
MGEGIFIIKDFLNWLGDPCYSIFLGDAYFLYSLSLSPPLLSIFILSAYVPVILRHLCRVILRLFPSSSLFIICAFSLFNLGTRILFFFLRLFFFCYLVSVHTICLA